MSNTTALESWGASKASTDAADDGEHAVAEHDITGAEGAELEHEHDEGAGDEALAGEGGDQVVDADAEAEAARLAAKKKKDMRTFMIAGIAAGVLIVGFIGFSVVKGRAARQQAQQEMAQQEQPQQGQGDAGQVIAPVAQRQEAPGAIINEHADGTPVSPSAAVAPVAAPPAPDFGLQAQAPAASAPVSAVAVAPVLPPAPASAAIAAPVVPAVPAGLPLRASAAAALAPTPKAVAAQAPAPAELDKLRAELATLRSDLEEKTRALDGVRTELEGLKKAQAPRPAPVKVAAPKVVAKKVVVEAKPAAPVAGVTETVVAAPAPVAAVAAPALTAAAKAKSVRTDYRIYAVVDGRVYVMGPDNETVQIAPRSPLADGSRVTSIDTEKNVVYTSAGEIR
jgi:hypothetical protein